MTEMSNPDDPRTVAAVDLIGRAGAESFQLRYCEEEQPVIWIAAACWGRKWEAAAAMNPRLAVFRLCDQVIDGGTCMHCKRPSGFDAGSDPMPLDDMVCWYQFDPGTKKFTRGCTA